MIMLCVGGAATGGKAKRFRWAKKYVHSKDQWNVWSTGREISTVGHVRERITDHFGVAYTVAYSVY